MQNENSAMQEGAKTAVNFKLIIEAKDYNWNQQYITGVEIRKLANLPTDIALFLAVPEPWKDQQITDADRIDLGRPDIEHFYYKRFLKLTVNKKSFEWYREYITGKQIKQLGNVAGHDKLFLSIAKPGEDELILDDAKVNLALPGVEHFYSMAVDKEVIIIVNGTPVKWVKEKISFKDVVTLAFGSYIDRPTMVYTVAYEDGPKENPEGSMVKDKEVFVKNKMIFHATATDKS